MASQMKLFIKCLIGAAILNVVLFNFNTLLSPIINILSHILPELGLPLSLLVLFNIVSALMVLRKRPQTAINTKSITLIPLAVANLSFVALCFTTLIMTEFARQMTLLFYIATAVSIAYLNHFTYIVKGSITSHILRKAHLDTYKQNLLGEHLEFPGLPTSEFCNRFPDARYQSIPLSKQNLLHTLFPLSTGLVMVLPTYSLFNADMHHAKLFLTFMMLTSWAISLFSLFFPFKLFNYIESIKQDYFISVYSLFCNILLIVTSITFISMPVDTNFSILNTIMFLCSICLLALFCLMLKNYKARSNPILGGILFTFVKNNTIYGFFSENTFYNREVSGDCDYRYFVVNSTTGKIERAY